MFWSGEIQVQTSRILLFNKLHENFRKPFLRITTNASAFKLYDAMSKRNWRIYHYYLIEGRVIEDHNGIIVKYVMTPALSSWISAFIMLFWMFYLPSICESIETGKWICLIIVTASICYFIDLIWQARIVKTRFEQILQI